MLQCCRSCLEKGVCFLRFKKIGRCKFKKCILSILADRKDPSRRSVLLFYMSGGDVHCSADKSILCIAMFLRKLVRVFHKINASGDFKSKESLVYRLL